jgi:hypothetical protein
MAFKLTDSRQAHEGNWRVSKAHGLHTVNPVSDEPVTRPVA